jgi:hypothetical protein
MAGGCSACVGREVLCGFNCNIPGMTHRWSATCGSVEQLSFSGFQRCVQSDTRPLALCCCEAIAPVERCSLRAEEPAFDHTTGSTSTSRSVCKIGFEQIPAFGPNRPFLASTGPSTSKIIQTLRAQMVDKPAERLCLWRATRGTLIFRAALVQTACGALHLHSG